MKKRLQTILIVLVILAIGLYLFKSSSAKTDIVSDTQINTEETISEVDLVVDEPSANAAVAGENKLEVVEMTYDHSGDLLDVTAGEEVGGIYTENKASGIAKSVFSDAKYSLFAEFESLPDPQGSDFYEGRIVRKGANFDVISTGPVPKIDGKYKNTFTSDQDLIDHDFYVLTIEPDDGDPAPAGHILEGTMKLIN